MDSFLTSSCHVLMLRYSVLFNDTNYHDWVPHMRLYMRGLHLWEFLTGKLPCPPPPSAPAQPVISEKTIADEKKRLIAYYDDRLASYESQFCAYRTWLDEDAQVGSVLVPSMEDRFSTDIVEHERSYQMWTFFTVIMNPHDSLLFLLLFVRSSLFTRVMIPLMLSSIRSLGPHCYLLVIQGSEGCS
jgi:hypothetical protein